MPAVIFSANKAKANRTLLVDTTLLWWYRGAAKDMANIINCCDHLCHRWFNVLHQVHAKTKFIELV